MITGCPRISRHQFHIWNFFPSYEMALGLTIFRYQGIFLQPKSTPCGTALKLCIIYIMSKTYHIFHFQIFPCHIYLYEAIPCVFKLAFLFQSGVGWKHQNWPACKKGYSSPETVKIKNLFFSLSCLFVLLNQNWPDRKKGCSSTRLQKSFDVLQFWADPGSCSPSEYVMIRQKGQNRMFWVIWVIMCFQS